MKNFAMKLLVIMLLMIHKITIADTVQLPCVNEVKIEKSWTTLADTAVLKLPSVSDEVDKSLGQVMKRGTKFNIELGYYFDGQEYLNQEFTGFVTRFHQTKPIKIELEDYAFLLKLKRVNKVWVKTDLKTVLNHLVSDTEIVLSEDVPNVELDKFRVSNINAFEALKKIKEEFGLTAYFRGKTLYAGLSLVENVGEVDYNFNRNIISENLTYRDFVDEAIEVKGKGIQPDNTVLEVTVGEPDGIQKKFTSYTARTKAELKVQAEEEMERLRLGRYEGGVKTFLFPYATFGMTANVVDEENPSKNGAFNIDKVTTTFSSNGGRKEIELGKKLT
ncbi:hypothetical protein [Flammeovirga aprica]|uniref:Uncharacterized protein n=1 Tax=Flammeovirga aprica JL-4 TaxID=694437 RepID=A0A7X9RUL6_9BACT|nr:hypothetical protein [Flammeovirga aprica]NME69004.1 hypothetical protein [Flammeovirga aprica JL-4]